MKFTPLKFQGPLAAGGVALMPFVYLQFTVPHAKGLIKLSDIPFERLDLVNTSFYLSLIGTMLIFTIIHLIFTIFSLRSLIQWRSNKEEYSNFINTPLTNIGIFSPIISLAMTMNVIFGPMSFFIPKLSDNLQVMMLPALIFLGLLWVILFRFITKVYKIWLSQPLDVDKLNFGWMLDVFALGMVSLTGTGIASLSNNKDIASIAAFMSLFTLSIGFFLFISKLIYLIYRQLRSNSLPSKEAQPSFLTVIPITCLFGVSFYKFYVYLEKYFSLDVKVLSYFIITFSYVITIGWGIFCLYLLSNYFKKEFMKNEFYPSQWGMVCALVGSQVLGAYVYGNYYPNSLLVIINYVSILLASVIYVLILSRYYQAKYPSRIFPRLNALWNKNSIGK